MNDSAKLQTEVEFIGHAKKVGKTLIHFFTHKNNKNLYIALASGYFSCTVLSRPRNEISQIWSELQEQ